MGDSRVPPVTSAMGDFSTHIKPWIDTALSFVFPDVCQLCTANRAKKREGYVC